VPREFRASRPRLLPVPLFVALLLLLTLVSPRARAETLEAPVGGKEISLGRGRVACDKPTGGWTLVGTGLTLKPPENEQAIGQAVELKVSADHGSCTNGSTVTLVAVGEAPTIDPNSVVVDVDSGTVEAHGKNLRGVGLSWHARSASGADVCHDPKPAGTSKRCVWTIGHDLPADPQALELSWIPPGGRQGTDVTVYDDDGQPLGADAFSVAPNTFLISRLVPPEAAVDLSTGVGEVQLIHPEAMSSVECTGASCSLANGKLVVRAVTSFVSSVDVRLTLAHNVSFKQDDHLEPRPTVRLSVLHCPLSFASGPPLRGVDGALTVVELEGRCAADVQALHFIESNHPLEVVRSETEGQKAWLVLRLGRVTANEIAITALRGSTPEIPVATARTETREPPDVRSVLEIPGMPPLSFIPSNRGAVVHVPPPGYGATLVLLPVEGVYRVETVGRSTLVVGDEFAAGVSTLRFGYRNPTLPGPLKDLDLAVLEDPLGRPIHEVNIPAPIAGTLAHPEPLAQVICSEGAHVVALVPGETAHLPYSMRDGCRLVVHRERLSPEYGTQKLMLEVDIMRADGTSRSDVHASQTLILRAGKEPLDAWLHGVQAPFDRLVVRLSHIADESHYTGAAEMLTTEPALKWTAVLGTGRARLYAAPTIPTGLYRFGDKEHSGLLSLNFGVISRLTWLDDEGHEGFLNLEFGLMVIGLASQSTTGQSLSQAGAVLGVGIGIPFANRSSATEASINLHLWYERDLSTPDSTSSSQPWSIIFGPSISIGNVGTNL
jgi:hypothetical protein